MIQVFKLFIRCLLHSTQSGDPRDELTVTNVILGSCTIAHWASKNDNDD